MQQNMSELIDYIALFANALENKILLNSKNVLPSILHYQLPTLEKNFLNQQKLIYIIYLKNSGLF